MDYENMSIEELEAENIRLSNEKAAIKQQQLELTAVLDRKLHLAAAQAKVNSMSPDERAAFAQVVSVQTAKVSGKVQKAGE